MTLRNSGSLNENQSFILKTHCKVSSRTPWSDDFKWKPLLHIKDSSQSFQ